MNSPDQQCLVGETIGVSRHERKEAEMVRVNVSKKTLVIALVVALLMIPAAAFAGSLFGDVDDGNTHFPGIEYMKDTGITVGCGDGTNYCPDQPVTRAQMGTFLYRMSGNDPATAPNVNADKLDGFHAADLSRAFSVWHDTSQAVTGSVSLVEVMDLPNLAAGSYVIIGKTRFRNDGGASTSVSCRLTAGGDFDDVDVNLAAFESKVGTFMVVHSFASNGSEATLNCLDFGSSVVLYDTKITAIGVSSLTNNPG
jgi:hypothetical protein